VTGTLGNNNCPPVTQEVVITLNPNPSVSIGPDVYLCKGMSYTFNPVVTPLQTYSYSWSPSAFLSNANISNPVGTFTTVGTFTYVLTVDPAAVGCSGFDTIVVHVLPDDFQLLNNDTVSCEGFAVATSIIGDPRFSYVWTPINFVADPTQANTLISPMQTQTYTLTASYPGCPSIQHDLKCQLVTIDLCANMIPLEFRVQYCH
jgi:hypothetical protein